MNIYLHRNGATTGPHSLDEISGMLVDGSLVPSDQAWMENQDGSRVPSEWTTVANIPGVSLPRAGANSQPAISIEALSRPNPKLAKLFKSAPPKVEGQATPPPFDSGRSLPRGDVSGSHAQAALENPSQVNAGTGAIRDSVAESAKGLCVLMHLSQFAAFCTCFIGYLLPVLIWQTNKNMYRAVDKQGRIIANWIISSLIYSVLVMILCFIYVGYVLAPFLIISELAFPIIGAWKASKGEVWNYPMSIQFFKV